MKTINDFLTPVERKERNAKLRQTLKNLGLGEVGDWLKYVSIINEDELVLNAGKHFYMAVRKNEEEQLEIKISSPIYRKPFVLAYDFTNEQIDAVHEAVVVASFSVPKADERYVTLLPQNRYSQYIIDFSHDLLYFKDRKVFHSDPEKVVDEDKIADLRERCSADVVVQTLVGNGTLKSETMFRRYPRNTEKLAEIVGKQTVANKDDRQI